MKNKKASVFNIIIYLIGFLIFLLLFILIILFVIFLFKNGFFRAFSDTREFIINFMNDWNKP